MLGWSRRPRARKPSRRRTDRSSTGDEVGGKVLPLGCHFALFRDLSQARPGRRPTVRPRSGHRAPRAPSRNRRARRVRGRRTSRGSPSPKTAGPETAHRATGLTAHPGRALAGAPSAHHGAVRCAPPPRTSYPIPAPSTRAEVVFGHGVTLLSGAGPHLHSARYSLRRTLRHLPRLGTPRCARTGDPGPPGAHSQHRPPGRSASTIQPSGSPKMATPHEANREFGNAVTACGSSIPAC